MNWLAHVFLSENHIEHQLGNMLADPLKCRKWSGASRRIDAGIKTHIIIDNFTDSHPIVSKSKALLTPRGHLKGVVLDILYDYFLSKHWDKYCKLERQHFLDNFRFMAIDTIDNYPKNAQYVIHRVVANKQLESYATIDGVIEAFKRIDNRLSTKSLAKDNCKRYIPLIKEQKEELEEMFLIFFPQLMQRVKESYHDKDIQHWRSLAIKPYFAGISSV